MSSAILIENLGKRFVPWPGPGAWIRILARRLRGGARGPARLPDPALDGVSLDVGAGQVVGIVGSNGAGKTTLLRILATLTRPDWGRACVNGEWIGPGPLADASERRIRASVGLTVGEERSFYWRLTGRANLEFFASLHDFPRAAAAARIRALAEALDMAGFVDRQVSDCSAGMRQRLALARALIADPPVLLLDEPTHGLDPTASRLVKDLVREMARRAGKAILLVTTRLDDAEEICDRIALMHRGKILAIRQGSTGGTDPGAGSEGTTSVLYRFSLEPHPSPARLVALLAAIPGVSEARLEAPQSDHPDPRPDPVLSCRLASEREALGAVLYALAEAGCTLRGIRSEPETIEDLFHRLIPSDRGGRDPCGS